jgi:lysozyme family protein
MASAWVDAIQFVLDYEGGYTLDPDDPGGATKFGISQKSYPDLNILDLTLDEAKQIYRRDFWQACHCDDLPRPLAIAVFDCAVNQGVGRATRILQKSLGVLDDGNIGPITIEFFKKATKYTAMRFMARRLIAYHHTMRDNPKLEIYALNWCYRVIKLSELIFQEDEQTA